MTKNILIITGIFPPDVGGAATYSQRLLTNLANYDWRANVLTYGRSQNVGNVFYVSRHWLKGLRHIIFFIKAIQLSLKHDVILAADSSFGAAFIGILAAKLSRRRFIVRVTGDYAWEQGRQRFGVSDGIDDFQRKHYGLVVELLRWCQSFTAKRADKVIAPSEYLKGIIIGWGVKEDNIEVIYNAVAKTDVIFSREEARRKVGLSGNVLVSAGRLVPWKGFEVLIDVVLDLKNSKHDSRLFIIGDGPEKDYLQSKIINQHLQDSVKICGALPKDELDLYIKAADVFVLNTGYEGFSHQIIEAMSIGTPIITTNIGGNPEIITSGENGILVGYNNKQQLNDAIINLLENDDLKQKISIAGVKKGLEFSEERMLVNLNKLLRII